MSELKFIPCPCCGSNRIIHFKTSKNRGYATCIDCGMRTRGCGNYENKDDLKWKDRATILWNTRKPMTNIVEKLEYEKERHEKDREYWSEKSWKDSCIYNECDMSNRKCECFEEAINIVKQEINNGN